MQGKIALEEHFSNEEFLGDIKQYFVREGKWDKGSCNILDITGRRLEDMDKNGIELTILSLSSPAVQAVLDPKEAVEKAIAVNDYIAEAIRDYKHRFASFCALPTQDPEASIKELHRCMKDLGMKGALINGFCQIGDVENCVYLDQPQYEDFWTEVEKLDAPIYLHPRMAAPSVMNKMYAGNNWMVSAAWGFHVETATHCLRLIASGLFDRHPNLKIVIGHMGELLPFQIWRITNRVNGAPRDTKCVKPFSYYLHNNFHITTSGNCSMPALTCAMMEMGCDRIMFSTDYPYETMQQAAEWFDNMPVAEYDRLKMGRLNAMKLFHLEDVLK